MAESKTIKLVKARENLTEMQADFIECVICSVRDDCLKNAPRGVEAVILKLLDEFMEKGEVG